MLATLALVVFVIYLFLQNASATLIPALALPFSILGTFIVMRLLDFSLNNMSLMAIILSFGFVVDDAIVMLENIVRHLEAGADRGARRWTDRARSVHDSQHDDLAGRGLHPGAVLGGIIGRLFREFAVTITTAVIISGSCRCRSPRCSAASAAGARARRRRTVDRPRVQRVRRHYARSLRFALRHRLAVLVLFFAVLAATAQMFRFVPKGFIRTRTTTRSTSACARRRARRTKRCTTTCAGSAIWYAPTRTCSARSPFSAPGRAAPGQ